MQLLPKPKNLQRAEGSYALPKIWQISLPSGLDQRVTASLAALGEYQMVEQAANLLLTLDSSIVHADGYRLQIAADGVQIVAQTAAGLFYGLQTLRQIQQQSAEQLPYLLIDDAPDFVVRGFMLDISRDKVPTMATLYALIDELASWKINQIQLYIEHTFAYQNHPTVWADASPLTAEEVRALDDFCLERFIELVPNQNCFGHMRRWLTKPAYRDLAECPDGCDTGDPDWGYFEEPFTLAPEHPGSIELVRSMLDELLPNFRTRTLNVGCDETVELGLGASAAAVAERGKGRVYLEFLQKLYHEAHSRGYVMQFWSDIILHYPELVSELPRDAEVLIWGYESHHPFEEQAATIAKAGLPFYVCPGTSSWNTVAGRTTNALENIASAAKHGLNHGAKGFLMTDWGDNGHWQPLVTSYLGLAIGAARAWNALAELDVVALLDTVVFADSNKVLGNLVYQLGDVYRAVPPLLHNTSSLFRILQANPAAIAELNLDRKNLHNADEILLQLRNDLQTIKPQRADGELCQVELAWAIDLLRHAVQRGLWVLDQQPSETASKLQPEIDALIERFQQVWLSRNRPGGLQDSLKHFASLRDSYGEVRYA
ncbi:MAG TPA: glycoside hydrolase [Herpetosiphon sp.]|uniref:beta-N-acetylhexosaminidase n=1 Tax=Herpetosiphon aurantiacus (strain ATCC 23779 / DSM 785 / 114-95) TaxID=316274 RepID=A9B0V5_HERA2|nr:glycoside hydrolase family 20 zincin-like fold domain-containing protein [Herpetosiphon sp.]ABX03825.1 Glycoside hydrolase, family 20, catalytic core [Herpetosiphon aurantiacus DSM 785]HBW48995.1 glycoside hydrolase [Herpetosiphon sp.]